MSTTDRVTATLREHIAVCEGLLRIEERENTMLTTSASEVDLRREREAMLWRLNRSVAALKQLSVHGEGIRNDPAVSGLLRMAQDVVTKTVALGRDNERSRLVRGLVPARHLPSANRERPHFVAELYRRNGA